MKQVYILLLSIITSLLGTSVAAQLKLGDQPTSIQKSVILDLQGSNGRQGVWLPRVSDTTDATGIDALNPPDGVMIFHSPTSLVMIRRNGFWSSLHSLAKVGSTTSTSNILEFQLGTSGGAGKDLNYSLNGTTGVITLNVPDAAIDTRGVLTTGTQTIAGSKTFSTGVTVSGATSNASNLGLGVTSATTPGSATDRYLTVNASGTVTLNSVSVTSTGTTRIKSYTITIGSLPASINSGNTSVISFTVPGGGLSTTSTVMVSPTSALRDETTINWARVSSATTITVSITANGNQQVFTNASNATFNFTVIEF